MFIFRPSFPLHDLTEALRFPLVEAQQQVQAPTALVFCSAMTVLSTAFQGLIDVELPTGIVVPPSLYMIVLAESGERKSGTDSIFFAPIREMQSHWEEQRKLALDAHETDVMVWSLQKKKIEAQMQQAIVDGCDCGVLKLAHQAHLGERPSLPQAPNFLHSDTTVEALLNNLHTGWPHGALVSSEAASILNGRAMQQMGPWNELWDAPQLLRVDRKTSGSFSLRDARLTISLMVQPKPFMQFLRRNESAAWESGLLARTFVVEPVSTQGTRVVLPLLTGRVTGYQDQFHERVKTALEQAIALKRENAPRKVLRFDPEARALWLTYASWIETNLSSFGGRFHDVKGFASKLANNAGRLAALIHFFESEDDEISLAATQSAIFVSDWFANEYLRLFGVKSPQSIALEWGNELAAWLELRWRSSGDTDHKISDLYQRGPGKIRKRDALNIAIDHLAAMGRIGVYRNSKPAFIRLNTQHPMLRPGSGI